MNPFTAYIKIVLPKHENSNIQDISQEKSIAGILLVGWIITIYSFIKWSHHDVSNIANAALIPIIGSPILVYCLKTKSLSLDILSNAGLSFLFFFSAVVIYNLGAIHSAHILWPAVIIMTAYITAGRRSGAVWSFISILFLFWLIYSDRSGYTFPYYELTEKQTLINQYSGYILPIILLWIGQEYAERLREDFLNGLNATLKVSDELTVSSELASSKLSGVINEAENSAVTLIQASTELSNTVTNMSNLTTNIHNGVDKQISASAQINQTLVEMASSVDQSNNVMSNIRSFMQQTEVSVANSAHAMEQTIQNMLRIKESNEGIRNTMSVISDIADQTNLLALNAAIEAARAGDQGRGFAVVADEVRSLSIKSNQAAGQIKKLLETALRDVNEGSETVDRAGIILTEIVDQVRDVTISISETAETMNHQNKAIEGIVKSSTNVEHISRENEEAVQHLQDGNNALSSLSNQLSSIAQTMHGIVRSQ